MERTQRSNCKRKRHGNESHLQRRESDVDTVRDSDDDTALRWTRSPTRHATKTRRSNNWSGEETNQLNRLNPDMLHRLLKPVKHQRMSEVSKKYAGCHTHTKDRLRWPDKDPLRCVKTTRYDTNEYLADCCEIACPGLQNQTMRSKLLKWAHEQTKWSESQIDNQFKVYTIDLKDLHNEEFLICKCNIMAAMGTYLCVAISSTVTTKQLHDFVMWYDENKEDLDRFGIILQDFDMGKLDILDSLLWMECRKMTSLTINCARAMYDVEDVLQLGNRLAEMTWLTHLKFGCQFNCPLDHLLSKLTNLTHLEISGFFNHPLETSLNNLTQLTHLTFASRFNHPLETSLNNLTQLTHLTFEKFSSFNRPLGDPLHGLTQLTQLTLSDDFNHSLKTD